MTARCTFENIGGKCILPEGHMGVHSGNETVLELEALRKSHNLAHGIAEQLREENDSLRSSLATVTRERDEAVALLRRANRDATTLTRVLIQTRVVDALAAGGVGLTATRQRVEATIYDVLTFLSTLPASADDGGR